MNVALWAAQAVLALIFAFSGLTKGTWSRERLLAGGQTSARIVPMPMLRTVAALEVLAAVGLLLPGLTGIATWLTPLAAAGLGVVMVGAAGIHLRLREPVAVLVNLTILATCVFVAVGRL
ncbi:DoxX family protein [Micromonospora haikouensis]|uniref:DoxX family protein n=1 Tax=Micromonospora haikouensis TaxID=686309 RepID=UPI003D72B8F1